MFRTMNKRAQAALAAAVPGSRTEAALRAALEASRAQGKAQAESAPSAPREGKYGAKRREQDGVLYASSWEARLARELAILEAAGEITHLRSQVPIPHTVRDTTCFVYVADFVFHDAEGWHIVDAKGMVLPAFRIKALCIAAQYRVPVECWFADGSRKAIGERAPGGDPLPWSAVS